MAKFRIGARIHDIFKAQTFDFGAALKSKNLDVIQLTMSKFFVDFDFENNDFSQTIAKNIKIQLESSGIDVSVLSCYINPVDPVNINKEKALFKKFVDYARYLGVKIVGTETGTIVEDLENDYLENYSDSVFETLIENLTELNEYAKQEGVLLGVECVSYFPVNSDKTLLKLMSVLGKSNITVILDPVNLLSNSNYLHQKEIMSCFIQQHHSMISVVHLKDFIVESGKIIHKPLFQGNFEIDYFLKLLIDYNVSCDIILENCEPENFYETISALRKKINAISKEQIWISDKEQIKMILNNTILTKSEMNF